MRRLLMIGAAALTTLALAGCGVVVDRRADLREAEAEARFPPGGQLIEVEGVTVHAVVAGSGPDLVLIHGASGNTRDFTFDFADRLTDRYRVIALDRPGLGWTDRLPGYGGAFNTNAETPREQARLLAAAARQLGADRPLVLGHSYGGAVAMAWALEEPLAGAVIVSGATMRWEGGLGPLYAVFSSALGGAAVVPLLTAFAPLERVRDTIGTIFAPQDPPPGYVTSVGAGLSLRRDSFRANARQVSSLKPHVTEMMEHYADITVPLELVHGTADTIVPADVHSVPLSQLAPTAELTLLDGIGHMPHHVSPDAVERAIDRAADRAGLR